MSKSLSVKVSTVKLVKALEAALAKREKEISDYKKAYADYEKERKDFQKALVSMVGTNKLILKETQLSNGWRNEPPTAVLTFTYGSGVKLPVEPEHYGHHYQHEISEIKNAIAILKMTDDETVSTNTYKGVAQYL